MNIADVLRRQAAARPNEPAYTCDDVTYSWSEVHRRVNRLATMFSQMIPRGGRVAVLSYTCHRYFETHFALARAGLVGVPLNHRLNAPELAHLLHDSGARALVLDIRLDDLAAAALSLLDERPVVISHGDGPRRGEDYEAVAISGEANEFSVTVADDDLHVLGYTSGTTGSTKGAMISHHSASSAAVIYALALGLNESDRVLACMPGYVYRGGSGGYAPAVVGAHTIVTDFDAKSVVDHLETHRITQATFAPAMATRVLDLARSAGSAVVDLDAVWLTGAPATPGLITELTEQFNCDVGMLYGMTEATGIAMIRYPAGRDDLLTSVGRPMLLLDVRVVDEDDREVPVGEVGEIIVRGDTVTAGYWNDPELSAEALRGGWFHTGDMAIRDEDGHLYIVDRRADIINSGGLNIYTSQVEDAIMSHRDVLECSVVGAPDETWGEVPVAVVVSRGGLTEPELIEWVGGRLASFKKPRRVEFVSTLPRNAMGKVDKKSLREPLWAGRARRVSGSGRSA